MNVITEDKIIPEMSPRLIMIPSRTVYHCQLCGTWCSEVYNQTYDIYEYHCYHHGIVAEVHKDFIPPSPDIAGYVYKQDLDHMVEFECIDCGGLFMRKKGSAKNRCMRCYDKFFREQVAKGKEKGRRE